MSGKQSKKMRKEFRRQYEPLVKVLAEQNARIVKGKPKWVPTPVWMFFIGFFVKVKK